MKTTLPAREEYHRPARARKLREKAAWLEQVCRALPYAVALGIFLLVSVGLLLHVEEINKALAYGWFGFMVLFVVLKRTLPEQVTRLRNEAVALEAEHQARYGALRPGVGNGEIDGTDRCGG
jgi:hypothetical protein